MPTKDQEALELARLHYQIETGLIEIYRIVTGSDDLERLPNEPIKLLEVNENTVPSGVRPIRFGPSPASGLNFASIVVEVTPDEYQRIHSHQPELPHGWKVGDMIPRPPTEEGR